MVYLPPPYLHPTPPEVWGLMSRRAQNLKQISLLARENRLVTYLHGLSIKSDMEVEKVYP